MEIRTLKYFLAVAREENMTRAAQILHVTQPTLSKTLKSLEEELGRKLFILRSFSIRLTEEQSSRTAGNMSIWHFRKRMSGDWCCLQRIRWQRRT